MKVFELTYSTSELQIEAILLSKLYRAIPPLSQNVMKWMCLLKCYAVLWCITNIFQGFFLVLFIILV